MIDYLINTEKVTGRVTTKDLIIIETPPIWRKFKGETFLVLINWLGTKGWVRYLKI